MGHLNGAGAPVATRQRMPIPSARQVKDFWLGPILPALRVGSGRPSEGASPKALEALGRGKAQVWIALRLPIRCAHLLAYSGQTRELRERRMPTVGSAVMLDRLGPKRSDADFLKSKLEAPN